MTPLESPHRRRADRNAAGGGVSNASYGACIGFVAMVALIGWADHLTGPELGFSLFYLVPIALTAWFCGRNAALVVATAAAISWTVAYSIDYHHVLLSVWNGTTRLIIYGSEAWLIAFTQAERTRDAALARTDALTGLANSRAFMEALSAAATGPEMQSVVILYLDCDNFKAINDRYGHAAGDGALQELAVAIGDAIRSDDLAARIAGDEFGILIRDADEATAASIARRIVTAAARVGERFPGTAFGVSGGIAAATSKPFDPDALLRAADDAMYAVKRGGKGAAAQAT